MPNASLLQDEENCRDVLSLDFRSDVTNGSNEKEVFSVILQGRRKTSSVSTRPIRGHSSTLRIAKKDCPEAISDKEAVSYANQIKDGRRLQSSLYYGILQDVLLTVGIPVSVTSSIGRVTISQVPKEEVDSGLVSPETVGQVVFKSKAKEGRQETPVLKNILFL